MVRRIRHILMLLILVSGAFRALAAEGEPDLVCIDTERRYWVVGMEGSIYTWKIDGVTQGSTSDALERIWDTAGDFVLEVQEHQEHCSGEVQTTLVRVFNAPDAFAGDPVTICPENTFALSTSTADHYSALRWTTGGDGTFDDASGLHPVYKPGLNDIFSGNVVLTLRAEGLGTATTCNPAVSTITLTISQPNLLSLNNPAPVCEPQTVDLREAIDTDLSEENLIFSYWVDDQATVPLAEYAAITRTGVYYIKAEDANGCSEIKPVPVYVYPQPKLVITHPEAVCEPSEVDLTAASVIRGSTIPSLSVTTYWSNVGATVAIADPTAISTSGTYYIKIVSEGGCFDLQPVTVTINALPNLAVTHPDAVCEASTIDLSDLSITGGSDADLDFEYYTDLTATTLLADHRAIALSGTYYIKGIHKVTKCSVIRPVTVIVHPLPILVITHPEDVCEPETVDLGAAGITQGSDAGLIYTYWTDPDASVELTNYRTVAVGGRYYIQATHPLTHCSVIAPVEVIVNPVPQLVIHQPATVCEPETVNLKVSEITMGSIISATSELTYWLDDLATVPLPAPESVSQTGTYYIKLQSGFDCYVIEAVTVTVNPQPKFITNNPGAICEPGVIDLSKTIEAEPGQTLTFTYWADEELTTQVPSGMVTAVGKIDYFIRAENEFGCSTVKPVEVIINPPPVLVIHTPPAACFPETVDLTVHTVVDQSLLAPASVLSYWMDDQATVELTSPHTIAETGIYYIKLEAGVGCFVIEPVEVEVNSLPEVKMNDPEAVCEPATIDLSLASIISGSDADLTWSYWTDADAGVPLNNYTAVASTGTYYLMGTNPLTGCSVVEEVKVTVNKPLMPTFNIVTEICLNSPPSELPLNSLEGISGTWNPSTIQTNVKATTTYTFTPVAGQCALPAKVIINVGDEIIPSFGNFGPYCYNATADNLPPVSNNGVAGSWNPSSISTSLAGETTYTFTPSDDECATFQTLIIKVYDRISASVSTDNESEPGKNDGQITVFDPSGGSNGYDYKLDDGSWQSSPVFSNLAPGTYRVWIRDTQVPSCPVLLGPESIYPSGNIIVTAVVTHVDCYGYKTGAIRYEKAMGGTGAFDYSIDNGTVWLPFSDPFTRPDLGAGPYPFLLRDAGDPDNRISLERTIDQPNFWGGNITAQPAGINRANLTATISGSGGTPSFDYLWRDGQRTATAFNLAFGIHQLTITDAKGCKVSLSYKVGFTVSAEIVTPILCHGDKATVRIKAGDGVGPFKLELNGSTIVNEIEIQVGAGKHSFVVVDYFGVKARTNELNIVDVAPVTAEVKANAVSCSGINDGEIIISNPTGGSGNFYEYRINNDQWITMSAASVTIGNLPPDSYHVELRDKGSICSYPAWDLTIGEWLPKTLAAIATDAVCYGETGSIDFTFTNVEDGIYTISHATGSFPDVAITDNKATVQAPAGTYNNLKLSVNGCSSPDGVNVQLNQGAEIIVQVLTVNPDCEVPTGKLTVTAPEAAEGISYTVTGINPVVAAQTNVTGLFEALTPGDYEVIATNAGGCSSVAYPVTVNAALLTPADPMVSVIHPTCTIAMGTITVTGPVAGISYTLRGTDPELPPVTAVTGVFAGLAAGNYEIWAVNAQGCPSGTVTETINVQPLTPAAPEAVATRPNCLITTGTITVNLPEAAPGISYTLRGTNPVRAAVNNTTGIFPGLAMGTYAVTTMNADSCTSLPISLTIDAITPSPAMPEADITVSPTCNNEDGTVLVSSPTGANLMYSIDGGAYQASPEFGSLKWGPHFITVKDTVTGCLSPTLEMIVPGIPPAPVLTAVADTIMCFGDLASIVFTVTNPDSAKVTNGDYTIKYEGGEFSNVRFTGGESLPVTTFGGNYRNLILTNPATGCDSYDKDLVVNLTIDQPSEFVIGTDSITKISLKSPYNGAIYLNVTGGTGKYRYLWDNDKADTTSYITNLAMGEYTVTVTDENNCTKQHLFRIPAPNYPPVAVDDEFTSSCKVITGWVLDNDTDPEGDDRFTLVDPVLAPLHGTLTLNEDGSFVYVADPLYSGIDSFVYVLYDYNYYEDVTGTVTLTIISDMDGDGIADADDPDADGDGILNIYEALPGEAWLTADFDGDGLPNWLDIDSDGDGIVDNIEGQHTSEYRPPVVFDADSNGINDAYDLRQSGYEIRPIDTDEDGMPDFLDPDSENDGVPDFIEGHDEDANGIPDRYPQGRDSDGDGLDDAYDTVFNTCDAVGNALGSNAEMQDFDGDGMRDWRDDNDDNDAFPTRFEDLNGDGDWSNDDLDYDGYPEYLDHGRECDLFIPNAFSPNGDNVHDYFQVYCINHFPDAKIYIFDQVGNKLYEKAHYGNRDEHPYLEDAWWDGKPNTGPSKNKDKLVAPGTYYYVLDLGNGEVKKSFVFVSY